MALVAAATMALLLSWASTAAADCPSASPSLIDVDADHNETAEIAESTASYSWLVIILDDMGNHRARGHAALELPGPMTYAIMPHTPYGAELAQAALAADKEIMLHAPMSTIEGTRLGSGGLTPALSREDFVSTLNKALASVPGISGVNNHMGSDLTQRRRQMAWLMQELRGRDLYFVDSRTSDKTVAATVAAEFRVPHLSRQVFLDNEASFDAIDERFGELQRRAHQEGLAVAIGHPYRQTIDYLSAKLPELEAEGFRLASVSQALALQASQIPTPASCNN